MFGLAFACSFWQYYSLTVLKCEKILIPYVNNVGIRD